MAGDSPSPPSPSPPSPSPPSPSPPSPPLPDDTDDLMNSITLSRLLPQAKPHSHNTTNSNSMYQSTYSTNVINSTMYPLPGVEQNANGKNKMNITSSSAAAAAQANHVQKQAQQQPNPQQDIETRTPLLQTTQVNTHPPINERYSDVQWLAAYAILTSLTILHALIFTTQSTPNSLFTDSTPHVLLATTVTTLFTPLYLVILRPIVLNAQFLIPGVSVALGIYIMTQTSGRSGFYNSPALLTLLLEGGKLREEGGTLDNWLWLAGFATWGVGALFAYWRYRHRSNTRDTLIYIDLANDCVRTIPALLPASMAILGCYSVFSYLWLRSFAALILTSTTILTYIIYIACFGWTTSIVRCLQRYMVSGTTCWWYFHRTESLYNGVGGYKQVLPPLKRGVTTSLGTLCLASILLALTSLIPPIPIVKNYLRRRFESFTNYTITYSSLAGESYIQSSKHVTALFRRNLLWGAHSDLIGQRTLLGVSYVITIGVAVGIWTFGTHTIGTNLSWVSALFGGGAVFAIARSWVGSIMDVVDTIFMCYALDLDKGTNHYPNAHAAYSNTTIHSQQGQELFNVEEGQARTLGSKRQRQGYEELKPAAD